MKNIIYVAHPIRGDIKGNVEKVLAICREVHKAGYIPVAPYLIALQYLDDGVKEEREMGIELNQEYLRRGFVNEVWLYGDRISEGMQSEVALAIALGIPVVPKTTPTQQQLIGLIVDSF